MKGLPTNMAESDAIPDLDPRMALVERAMASRHFSRAPRIKAFLAFVAERAISGRADAITEQEIAAVVFDRRENFHPSNDNIVRVAARQLRTKLKDFELEEGVHEDWVVEIPKGSYTPVFHKRSTLPPADLAPARWRDSAPWIAVALACVVVIVSWALWQQSRAPSLDSTGSDSDSDLFSAVLLSDRNRAWIVPADSALSLQQLVQKAPVGLDEYTAVRQLPQAIPKWLDHPDGRTLWQALESRHLVHAALVAIPESLVRNRPDAADRVHFRHPRTLSTRDFKSDNFALLGLTNPWVELFESGLNFQVENNYPFGATRIVSRRPRNGEPTAFAAPKAHANDMPAFARVALVPNLAKNGRVLIVTGLGTFKTEAASEFLLRRGSARLVRQALGVSERDRIPDFEMVLQASEVGGAGTSARIVASRSWTSGGE